MKGASAKFLQELPHIKCSYEWFKFVVGFNVDKQNDTIFSERLRLDTQAIFLSQKGIFLFLSFFSFFFFLFFSTVHDRIQVSTPHIFCFTRKEKKKILVTWSGYLSKDWSFRLPSWHYCMVGAPLGWAVRRTITLGISFLFEYGICTFCFGRIGLCRDCCGLRGSRATVTTYITESQSLLSLVSDKIRKTTIFFFGKRPLKVSFESHRKQEKRMGHLTKKRNVL